MPQIGPVHDKDVPGLLEIYRSCLEIPITFECQLPALKEPAGRIRRISGEYPYLVCRSEGELAGYAYTKKSIAKCRTYANAARRKSWLFKKYNQLNRNSSVLPDSLSCGRYCVLLLSANLKFCFTSKRIKDVICK